MPKKKSLMRFVDDYRVAWVLICAIIALTILSFRLRTVSGELTELQFKYASLENVVYDGLSARMYVAERKIGGIERKMYTCVECQDKGGSPNSPFCPKCGKKNEILGISRWEVKVMSW